MRASTPVKVAALMLIGALNTLSAGWLMAALTGGPAAALGLSMAAYETRTATAALGPPPDLARATAATDAALAQAPADIAAWLRLAYIDSLDGQLDAEGLTAFQRSYSLVAFDQYTVTWRTRFALDHWETIPPELRAQVRREALGFLGTKKAGELRQAWLATPNARGRLASSLWVAEHRRRARLLSAS